MPAEVHAVDDEARNDAGETCASLANRNTDIVRVCVMDASLSPIGFAADTSTTVGLVELLLPSTKNWRTHSTRALFEGR